MSAFLPPEAGVILEAASHDDVGRMTMQCVRVKIFQEGYRLEATDGRWAAVLRGPHAEPPKDVQLPECPEGSAWDKFDFLVPADVWKNAFKLGNKKPICIAASPEGQIAIAGVNGMQIARAGDGRFPDVAGVFPGRASPLSFSVNPEYVIRAMKLCQTLLRGSDDGQRVNFLWYGVGHPVGVTARRPDGLTLDMLIMPLIEDGPAKSPPASAETLPGDEEGDEDDAEEAEEDAEEGDEEEEEDEEAEEEDAEESLGATVPPDGTENGDGH